MVKLKIPLVTLSVVCICALAACSPSTSQQGASILESLPDAEYPIELASTGKAQLEDGVFEEGVAPGSATKTRIALGEQQAAGDLNGDGAEDAAVTLVADPGGSGTFTYLAAVVNQDSVAQPVASVFLGDRIVVKSLTIQSGEIVVTFLTREPDEPMATEPTVEVTQKFELQGSELTEAE